MNAKSIFLLLIVLALVAYSGLVLHKEEVECDAKGGVLVRSLAHYVCAKEQK